MVTGAVLFSNGLRTPESLTWALASVDIYNPISNDSTTSFACSSPMVGLSSVRSFKCIECVVATATLLCRLCQKHRGSNVVVTAFLNSPVSRAGVGLVSNRECTAKATAMVLLSLSSLEVPLSLLYQVQ